MEHNATSFLSQKHITQIDFSPVSSAPKIVTREEFETIENEFLDEMFFHMDQQSSHTSDVMKVWTLIVEHHPSRLIRVVQKCIHFVENIPERFSHAHDFLLMFVIPDRRLPSPVLRLLRSELTRIKETTPYKTILRAVIELEWNLDKHHP